MIASAYDCLKSRYVAHTDDQNRYRELQVREAKPRLLMNSPEGEIIFNQWKRSDLKKYSMLSERCYPMEIPVQIIEEN